MRIKCDEKCNKAWGLNTRPQIQLDENNEDDYCFLSDLELEEAPIDPGTYEGFEMCAKPKTKEELGNKWCIRECERCFRSMPGESVNSIQLHDFNKRFYNILIKNETNT